MRAPKVVFSGTFTLRDDVTEGEFIPAFRAFYDHLIEAGYATGYRLMRKETKDGFGGKLMPFAYQAELDFPDLATDDACYGYVQTRQVPMHSLHVAMRHVVAQGSADFFRTTCITAR